MNFELGFTDFMTQTPEPSADDFATWNRLRMFDRIVSGNHCDARVYAIELVRWARRASNA